MWLNEKQVDKPSFKRNYDENMFYKDLSVVKLGLITKWGPSLDIIINIANTRPKLYILESVTKRTHLFFYIFFFFFKES